MDIENTDLERRVLAHERILQTLIAHMAESQPAFLRHLQLTFGDLAKLDRAEHDYTDTASYAEQFVRNIVRHQSLPVAAGRSQLAQQEGR